MHLLVTVLVAAVLSSQDTVSAQCSPQCSCGSPDGSWSPLYRMLAPSPPSPNDIVPRSPPPRCSCGCSPRRLPPRLPTPPPNNAQQSHGVSSLSGVVMDSPVFQQVGPATVIQTPSPMYSLSSPDVQGGSSHSCDTPSHIMTIPRKQDSLETFSSFETPSNSITTIDDTSSSVTYCTAPDARPAVIYSSTADETPAPTYSTAPQQMSCEPPPSNSVMPVPQPHLLPSPPQQMPCEHPPSNSVMPVPQPHLLPSPPQQMPCEHPPSNSVMPVPQPNFLPPPPQPQPHPVYFTQPAPMFASCPATLFYPAPPAMTCPQPNFIYSAPPSYTSAPSVPTTSQFVTPGTNSHTTYSTTDNTPTITHSTPTPSQDIPCNAPQAAPSPSQTFSHTNQNTPSNTVSFSTSAVQQPPTNSVHSNTNCQQHQSPSNTVFFHDADSTDGSTSLLPETHTGPTHDTHTHDTPTHDSPLTYTLLTSGTNNEATDTSRDCSVPVPPVLV